LVGPVVSGVSEYSSSSYDDLVPRNSSVQLSWITSSFGTMITMAEMVADMKIPSDRNTTVASTVWFPNTERKYVKLPTTAML